MKNIVSEIYEYWRKENLSLTTINKNIPLFSTYLPDDFIKFYTLINELPSDMDTEGFHFYAPKDVIAHDEYFQVGLNQNESESLKNTYIFIDYMASSWWYAVQVSIDTYQIGIIPNKGYFIPITTSLQDFLVYYLQDDTILYNV